MSSKSAAGQSSKELLLDLLQLILDKSDIDPAFAKRLRYAHRRGYIASKGSAYSLTQKGRAFLTELKIWNLVIPTPARWDGKWRLVVFDIPVDKRKRRDSFRRRLKELGLVLYQNSVWIYPYPCEEIIQQVADFYMISSCVSFVVASDITDEYHLLKKFSLT